MDANIRHVGVWVKQGKLAQTVEFYRWFGLRVISRSAETWKGRKLEIVKMVDRKGRILELIEGDWKPHIALTVKDQRAMDKIWAEWVRSPGDAVAYKENDNHQVVYIADPSGNWVEVVNEKEGK